MALFEVSSVHINVGQTLLERGAERGVVSLLGEHDAFTVSPLREALSAAIAADVGEVVVDLSRVDFMGVATVGVIVEALERLEPMSRSLVVRSPSARARRVLELCGCDPLITST